MQQRGLKAVLYAVKIAADKKDRYSLQRMRIRNITLKQYVQPVGLLLAFPLSPKEISLPSAANAKPQMKMNSPAKGVHFLI